MEKTTIERINGKICIYRQAENSLDLTTVEALVLTKALGLMLIKPDYDVYVDGSYLPEIDKASWAFIVVQDGNVVHQENGIVNSQEATKTRNVAGELAATMRAAVWVGKREATFKLFYDYEGIEKWLDGSWEAKNVFVKQYVEFMKKYLVNLVAFEHTKAHTGIEFNEKVDQLAKDAFKEVDV
jgi:ribonuclease HI